MTERNFGWDPGIFKVLSIRFLTDTERLPESNDILKFLWDGKPSKLDV